MRSSAETDDLYALGAVIYFLLTGRYYDANKPVVIEKLRRGVPQQLKKIVANLLKGHVTNKNGEAAKIRRKLEKILSSSEFEPRA
jgi:hypothetical protein